MRAGAGRAAASALAAGLAILGCREGHAHDATVLAVQNRSVEGGGVERRIMNRLFDSGQADRSSIRIIQEELVEGYPWVVRAALDRGLVERITQAYLDISDPELLRLMRAERYARVTAADYDTIRSEARRLGLLR